MTGIIYVVLLPAARGGADAARWNILFNSKIIQHIARRNHVITIIITLQHDNESLKHIYFLSTVTT